MKFVHAADLHIDSPLRGLERYEGAPVDRVRGATRRAFENLVDLCLVEDVAFLLLAGDIFDGDWKDYGTGLFFLAQAARLGRANIPLYLVRGNHDAASQVTKYLNLPAHVHEFSSRQPETKIVEVHGVALHGQSFPTRAVTEDLALAYPPPERGLLNIGLLHTSVEGRVGHEPYAPCTVAGLAAKGYDYWALGHVHAREVLAVAPWIVFPGNPQGRHARETGPKGASVVTVDDTRIVSVESRVLDVVRWSACDVDASEAVSADDALDLVRAALERAVADADGHLVAAPVTLRAGALVHRALVADAEKWTQQLRAIGLDVAGDGLWIERVRFQTLHAPLANGLGRVRGGKGTNAKGGGLESHGTTAATATAPAPADEDAVSQFINALRALREDDTQLAALSDEFLDLRRKLPGELSDAEDGLRLDEPATLRRMLDEVESLVVGRLAGGRGEFS